MLKPEKMATIKMTSSPELGNNRASPSRTPLRKRELILSDGTDERPTFIGGVLDIGKGGTAEIRHHARN